MLEFVKRESWRVFRGGIIFCAKTLKQTRCVAITCLVSMRYGVSGALVPAQFVAQLWRGVSEQNSGGRTMGRATFNISMPAAIREYVEKRVSGGRFGSVSEYFRDLVRKDHFWVQEELRQRAAISDKRSANERSAIGYQLSASFRRDYE